MTRRLKASTQFNLTFYQNICFYITITTMYVLYDSYKVANLRINSGYLRIWDCGRFLYSVFKYRFRCNLLLTSKPRNARWRGKWRDYSWLRTKFFLIFWRVLDNARLPSRTYVREGGLDPQLKKTGENMSKKYENL